LARDVDARCRLRGRFTLRSGRVSSEYFDKYQFEADPALLARVTGQMTAWCRKERICWAGWNWEESRWQPC
jgi:orotate phosphoribosyltransferase